MITRTVYRLRVLVGPCQTDRVAHRLRAAGYADVLAGTEHVHFDAPAMDAGWGALGAQVDAFEAVGLECFCDAPSSIIRSYERLFDDCPHTDTETQLDGERCRGCGLEAGPA